MTMGLDHVGVVTRDLSALVTQYERLGFTLTPLARYADGRIGNRCVMLQGSYIELLAVIDPLARSATLDRFLARHAGVHIMAFSMSDEAAEVARLREAGVEAAVSHTERPVDDANPDGPRAAFALIQLPDQPEGRINLVRHLAPSALWRDDFLQHDNAALSLHAIEIAVAEPSEVGERLSRMLGCTTRPLAGDVLLDLPRGAVRLTRSRLPGLPQVTELSLRTADDNAAIRSHLRQQRIEYRQSGTAITVDASAAGGVALHFEPSI